MSTTAPAAVEKTMVERQIDRAKALEQSRGELQEAVTANRDFLRLMAKNKELSPAQTKWLTTFYPEKEKGSVRSDEDVEATRKARAAARKGE